MWKDYAVPGGTFRENLLGIPGQKILPADHPGAQFRYENLKKQPGVLDAEGDIIINRRDSEPKAEPAPETVQPDTIHESIKMSGNPVVIVAA